MRPYILGLNSPQGSEPSDATIKGSSGERLWQMVHERTEIPLATWMKRTQRISLLEALALPSNYRKLAKARGAYLRPMIRGRVVVLLGQDVADAVGHMAAPFVWEGTWVMIPHPSGKTRTYSDPAYRAAVGALMEDVLWMCVVWKGLDREPVKSTEELS